MLVVSYLPLKSLLPKPQDWIDVLGCVPVLAFGGEYPQEIWASSMMNVPYIAEKVQIYISERYLKLDRFKVLTAMAGGPVSASEYMECINMDLSDNESLFLCHPERTALLCDISLTKLHDDPEETLAELFHNQLAMTDQTLIPDKSLIQRLLFNMEALQNDNLHPWMDDVCTGTDKQNDRLSALLQTRARFDLCILPILLECMQDCKLSTKKSSIFKTRQIQVTAPDTVHLDLEAMFYGLCCKQYAIALQTKLVNELKNGCSGAALEKIWYEMLECYVMDPRILTAYQRHLKPNDPCPCECGRKWKQHYGKMTDGIMKVIYPKKPASFLSSNAMGQLQNLLTNMEGMHEDNI